MKHPAVVGIDKVFSAKIREGKIRFREECDQYFTEYLTSDETRAIAAELMDLANQLDIANNHPGDFD